MTDRPTDLVVRKQVKVDRYYPEELTTHFVSNFVSQHQPDHFIVSFFELFLPPVLGDTSEERQQVIDEIDSVKARCVARIVLTPDKMRELVSILSDNLANYDKLLAAVKERGGE
jgi:hypothetical protein